MANSVKKDPRLEEILFTQEQLEKRIKELASWVNKTYKGSKDLILVGLLKGSIPFMAQLIKDIKVEHMLDFIIASSYSGDTKSTGNVKLVMDLNVDIYDKDVLIIEDIIDSGITLYKVYAFYFADKGLEVTATDITPRHVEVMKEMAQSKPYEIDTRVLDATDMSVFADESFDVV